MKKNDKKILIVEDEKIVANDIKKTLEKHGYKVIAVSSNYNDSIKMSLNNDFDLALLDIKISGKKDGIEIAKYLKNLNVPFVYLTAYYDKNTVLKARKTEPYGFISKPFNEKELLSVVDIALQKSEIEKRLTMERDKINKYLDVVGIMIVVYDNNGKVNLINRQGCEILGYKNDKEIIGKDWFSNFLPKNIRKNTRAYFEKIMKGRVKISEIHINNVLRKDGQERILEWRNVVLMDEKGNLNGMLSSAKDITDQIKFEKELAAKNKINNEILEKAPVGIYIVNSSGGVDYVNNAMLNISSANYSRFMGLNMFKHKNYIKLGLDKKIKEGINGKGFKVESVEYTSMAGKKTTIRNFIGIPLDDKNEKKLLMIVEDITKYRQYEEEISQKNKFLNLVIDSLDYPFYVIDAKNYNIILSNKFAEKVNSKKYLKCYESSHHAESPCNSDEHKCPLEEIKKTKKPFMTEHIHFDEKNNKRYVEVHGYPIFANNKEVSEIIEYSIDITERKIIQEKLKEQEARSKDILDNASDLIQSVAPDGSILYVNRAWRETMGYGEEEIKKINIFDVIKPEVRDHCAREFNNVKDGKMLTQLKTIFIAKDGRELVLEGGVSCKFENGTPVSTRGVFRDVTEKEKAIENLKNSEEKYRTIFETAASLIISVGKDMKIIDCNTKSKLLLGYEKNEIVGKSIFYLMDPKFNNKTQNLLKQVFQNEIVYNKKCKMHKKNGDLIDINVNSSGIREASGKVERAICIIEDVTQQRREEVELKKRNEELERFNKVSVGRELKMIELKNRIKELEKKLSGI